MNRPYILPDVPSSRFDELNPSEVMETAWIYAFRKKGTYFNATPKSGKWLIFLPLEELDDVWRKVKEATEIGLLGTVSKVATAYENPYAKKKRERVICVNTYDADDRQDVSAIRNQLRVLGISKKIPYKLDSVTQARQYSVQGDSNISYYFE